MGPDSIPASILKSCADTFAPILLHIFKKSYKTGVVPHQMKMATVVPLHKGGDKTSANNYRPVSLTPIIAKIFENIVFDTLIAHIEANSIMSPYQHGFLKNRSTNTNLIHFWEDITRLAEAGNEISIIYTDLRKAFDSVPHDLLVYKLKKYGITGKNIAWISDFLRGRQQFVRINDKLSHPIDIESGVPQGGVLSGILFNLYINDLPKCLKYVKPSLYADDSKLYGPVPDEAAKKMIQKDLDSVAEWCRKWRLRLNEDKCFYIHYRPRKCPSEYPVYYIGGSLLQRKSSTTDLGIIMSDDLKFHLQTQKACKEATRQINIIRRSFVSRSAKFLSNMFKSYVRPKLEYCVQVWNPVYVGDCSMMEKVQNRLTRMLPRGNYLTPEERNSRLKITDHKTRRLRGDPIHIYKMYDNQNLFSRAPSGRTG